MVGHVESIFTRQPLMLSESFDPSYATDSIKSPISPCNRVGIESNQWQQKMETGVLGCEKEAESFDERMSCNLSTDE
jgi:hypothetical protein